MEKEWGRETNREGHVSRYRSWHASPVSSPRAGEGYGGGGYVAYEEEFPFPGEVYGEEEAYDSQWDEWSCATGEQVVLNKLCTKGEQREIDLTRAILEMPRDNEREFRFTMIGMTVSVPFEGTYAIDWGDGHVELETKRDARNKHCYRDMKTSHQIKIFSFHPEFYRDFRLRTDGDDFLLKFKKGLISIEQWGQLPLQRAMFMDCTALEKITDPLPPFQLRRPYRHGVPTFVAEYENAPRATDLSALFKNCSSLMTITGFSSWDMRRVTHAIHMMQGSAINIDINDWRIQWSPAYNAQWLEFVDGNYDAGNYLWHPGALEQSLHRASLEGRHGSFIHDNQWAFDLRSSNTNTTSVAPTHCTGQRILTGEETADPKGQACVVCLEEYEEGQCVSVFLNCGHMLHDSCMKSFLEHDETRVCPICRTTINKRH
jgi:hypothetical protein